MQVEICCSFCHKVFTRPIGRFNEAEKFGWKQYCSSVCLSEDKTRGKVLKCSRPGCRQTFFRLLNQIQKVDRSYCSQKCSAIVNNKRFPRKTRELKACDLEGCSKMVPLSQKYCSVSCYSSARLIPKKLLIQEIRETAQKLKRTPAKRELLHIAHACIWAFGSWNNAITKAGLEPQRSHSQRMYKRTNTIALDGHKCDSISEALIDNWLTRHKVLHTRNVSYPTTGHKADWGIGGKIFIEYFGLVKDSPRYDRSIRKKRKLCHKNGIRLIEIYPNDLYPTERLNEKLLRILPKQRVI